MDAAPASTGSSAWTSSTTWAVAEPAIDIGQIEGAFVQGLGWLTTEEAPGRQWTARVVGPQTYKILTAAGVPKRSPWSSSTSRIVSALSCDQAVGELLLLAMSVVSTSRDPWQGPPRTAPDLPAAPERVYFALEAARSAREALTRRPPCAGTKRSCTAAHATLCPRDRARRPDHAATRRRRQYVSPRVQTPSAAAVCSTWSAAAGCCGRRARAAYRALSPRPGCGPVLRRRRCRAARADHADRALLLFGAVTSAAPSSASSAVAVHVIWIDARRRVPQ